jgi:hypothetical protein
MRNPPKPPPLAIRDGRAYGAREMREMEDAIAMLRRDSHVEKGIPLNSPPDFERIAQEQAKLRRKMEAPNERCEKCNWWLLLGEIRDEFEMKLESLNYNRSYKHVQFRKSSIPDILKYFTRSAHKVCKEHWEGKR